MELKTKLQKRVAFQPTGLVMRKESDTPMIDGVAIVVNKETVLWEGSDYREIEVIDPNCIRDDFIRTQDIKINLLHERELSFNRYPSGALVLDTREDGLHFAAPGDDSAIARQATDLIKNGTYTGCSFEFWPKDYEITERIAADGKTEYVIRHNEFAKIGAITIGMDPAYESTSVNAREILDEMRECGKQDEECKKEEPNCEECPLKEECQGKNNKECQDDKEEQCKAKENAEREKKTRESSLAAIQRDVELTELEQKYINNNF